MTTTRASARLAKAKAIKPEPVVEDVDPVSAKAESEYNESDDEDTVGPSRKRPRIQNPKPAPKPGPKKRQVRGKQGRLAGLMLMPIDIFTEIASYLLPHDIIVLTRSNKFFRKLLLDRGASHIWLNAMRNIKGVPECPPDLSIPKYLTLLFSKYCSMCGASAPRRMDENLHVRFCAQCRKEHVMQFYRVPLEIMGLLNRSTQVVPSKRRYRNDPHVLKSEVHEVHEKYEELRNAGDSSALDTWRAERKVQVEERAERAKDISLFLDTLETERDHQLLTIKIERRQDIERRLMELGWEKEDMKFTYFSPSRRLWFTLVEQPKPLTDRIWQNLREKLIPLLESNREERLERERITRQTLRRDRLVQLLSQMKTAVGPVLQFSVRQPLAPGETTTLAPNSVSYNGVFPDYTDVLQWPVVKTLYDADTDVAQFDIGFEQHRAQINVQIAEWKVNVHTTLAKLLRQGRPAIKGDIIKPTLIITENGADPLAGISDDLKYLLRADSFFTIRPGNPLALDAAVVGGYTHTADPGSMRPIKRPLDLARIKRYDEARDAAQVLLKSMNKPDACYLEMRSVGQQYACGRCHDSRLRTWEEMVQHYTSEKREWIRIQGNLKTGTMYNNVHDPARLKERPLIKYMSSAQVGAELAASTAGSVKGCKLCLLAPIHQEVGAPETKIITHLREVHGIAKPKFHEHYDNMFMIGMAGPLHGFDMDLFSDVYDEFFDDDEPMWGYDSDEEYLWGW